VILCRMLFESKKGTEFRRPLMGGAHSRQVKARIPDSTGD
jgi:hypothetical protein